MKVRDCFFPSYQNRYLWVSSTSCKCPWNDRHDIFWYTIIHSMYVTQLSKTMSTEEKHFHESACFSTAVLVSLSLHVILLFLCVRSADFVPYSPAQFCYLFAALVMPLLISMSMLLVIVELVYVKWSWKFKQHVIDADWWSCRNDLTHDVCFHFNNHTDYLTGMVELTNRLEVVFGMHGHSCLIGKQYFSDEYLAHLVHCPKSSQVE